MQTRFAFQVKRYASIKIGVRPQPRPRELRRSTWSGAHGARTSLGTSSGGCRVFDDGTGWSFSRPGFAPRARRLAESWQPPRLRCQPEVRHHVSDDTRRDRESRCQSGRKRWPRGGGQRPLSDLLQREAAVLHGRTPAVQWVRSRGHDLRSMRPVVRPREQASLVPSVESGNVLQDECAASVPPHRDAWSWSSCGRKGLLPWRTRNRSMIAAMTSER